MNKLNNKGYMLVEIILASAIAFGLAYFLIDLTINLKNKNDDLLVETLVSTDQAIITNIIMADLGENSKNFKCDNISISGNKFTYTYSDGTKKINKISEYAIVESKSCSVSNNDGNMIIKITIPIKVTQLQNKDFSINISYSESY